MRKFICALLLIALSFASCGHAETDYYFLPQAEKTAPAWTYPVPLSVLKDPNDVLRLINRKHLLDKTYPDQNIDMYKLVNVTVPKTKNEKFTLRNIANDALTALVADAEAEDIKLYIGSAYRNYRSQEVSYYNRVKRLGRDDGIVQMAGASEHQAGLAADVVSWAYRDGFNKTFAETEEGIWLAANCAQYGFIIRYPKDKSDITGIDYEPWHLRYVGTLAATYIMESGLALEEFTEEWQMALAEYEQTYNPES